MDDQQRRGLTPLFVVYLFIYSFIILCCFVIIVTISAKV